MKPAKEWQAIIRDRSNGKFGDTTLYQRDQLPELLLRELAGYRQNAKGETRDDDRYMLDVVLHLVELEARKLEREVQQMEAARSDAA